MYSTKIKQWNKQMFSKSLKTSLPRPGGALSQECCYACVYISYYSRQIKTTCNIRGATILDEETHINPLSNN